MTLKAPRSAQQGGGGPARGAHHAQQRARAVDAAGRRALERRRAHGRLRGLLPAAHRLPRLAADHHEAGGAGHQGAFLTLSLLLASVSTTNSLNSNLPRLIL